MAIFFIVTVVRLVTYGVSGLLTSQRLLSAVVVMPAILLGIGLGSLIEVKIAERTIGAKMGTGGSAGAEYLRQTLFRPLFPDLWAIRSRL